MSEARTASFDEAVAHARKMLDRRPDLAEQQARAILGQAPAEPRTRLILGAALRRQGRPDAARDTLSSLAREQPRSAETRLELAMALAALGEDEASFASLREAVRLKPAMPEAWRLIAEHLHLRGDAAGADAAYARYIQAGIEDPALRAAAEAMVDDALPTAERLLRERLRTHPSDVAAMRMLAEIGTRLGRYADAQGLLEMCLELAPSFQPARHNLALVLFRQQKAMDALPHVEALRALDPAEPNWRLLHASCLSLVGDYAGAVAIFEEALAKAPRQPRVWLSLGHALRTEGRRAQAVAAYKQALAYEPSLGDAYWSLANLKTEPFTDEEVTAIETQLALDRVVGEDRLHLNFALGKALEDRRDFARSFENYEQGARLRRDLTPYDGDEFEALVARSKAMFTDQFFMARRDWGSASDAPIFIVGLPRSGSTLIEQILASHSQIEGTMELPEIGAIARRFVRDAMRGRGDPYPEVISSLDPGSVSALGDEFLERTKVQRKLGAAFFIDKMPNNFHHLGLIALILPKARVIDARRHPMAAGFSAFKQHFAQGHNFSYDLSDIGRYYRGYVELMAHFDAVLPGRVHRVIHEALVDDLEGEARRLLAYLRLPFEPGCLEFHRTERAVRTASSEQVRRPIFREGLEHWRNFEPWLFPLAEALGPALQTWRD
ncbi:MAG TPA: sulfotransferase [Methylosinus sp.]|jgi:predicted Zn-dependent protease|uniref:sulfotransferase n=1 Tax=Methylosinus sp. TaxID=427 RepID=UPI002F933271|nr:sulfotransferase [Caulobacteraceae bacterium]